MASHVKRDKVIVREVEPITRDATVIEILEYIG